MKRLLWFRNDLRLRDNQTLAAALQGAQTVMGVYFLRSLSEKPKDLFLLQTLQALSRDLEPLGIRLLVFLLESQPSYPQQVAQLLHDLMHEQAFDQLYFTAEENSWAQEVELAVMQRQKLAGAAVRFFYQRTLLAQKNLPFAVGDLPMVFTTFRKAVEAQWVVEAEVVLPKVQLARPQPLSQRQGGEGSLYAQQVDLEGGQGGSAGRWGGKLTMDLQGGEGFGLARMHDYFSGTHSVRSYKERRNGLLVRDDSSKFSAWLANGSLSPRTIYFELKNYEAEWGANDSTYWLIFELLWRDYFKFLAAKSGAAFFKRSGLLGSQASWAQDSKRFQAWCQGETGVDWIDAHNRELLLTGWMSNRGRQNVASYLAKVERIDWTWGAQWFAENLIDLDVESNWGNWLYLAGVGTDPRDRLFNADKQAQQYDPDHAYRNQWLKRREEGAK